MLGGVGVLTVWLDAWQRQCCGEPFKVGSRVTWSLADATDDEFSRHVLPQGGPRISHREESHGNLPEGAPQTTGAVRAIRVVTCRYAPPNGSDGRTLYPVAGSAELTVTWSADGWEPEVDGRRFVGYVVEIETG